MIIQKIRKYSCFCIGVALTMLIASGCENSKFYGVQPNDSGGETATSSNLENSAQSSKKSDSNSQNSKSGKESKEGKAGKEGKADSKSNVKNTLASTKESTNKSIYMKPDIKAETRKLADKSLSWYIIQNKENKTPSIPQNAIKLLKESNSVYIGNTQNKVIYLTFDSGYENGYTSSILDTLSNKNVKASFFITGDYYRDQKKFVERMIKDGHIVGNHTMNHPDITTISEDKLTFEIEELTKQFKNATGLTMKYFRTPSGNYNEKTLNKINNLGYKTIFWSFAYLDYDVKKQNGTTFAYNSIMNNLHNGAILLLHTVSKDNAEVLPSLIDDIRAKGYTLCILDF